MGFPGPQTKHWLLPLASCSARASDKSSVITPPMGLFDCACVVHQSHEAELVRYDGVLYKDKYPVSDLISQLLSGRRDY